MKVDLEDVRYLPDSSKARDDDLLVEGDLLFTRLSGSLDYVANCAIVRGLESRRVYYPDRLFRARLIRPEQGPFFEVCFASPLLRTHLTVETKSSAGHQRISMGAVTNFPIPVPPERERVEIVRRVEALFKLSDRIEAHYTAARTQAQRLTPLLLAKAFRGELVPQDPNDEPAADLLVQIHSRRAASGTASKPKRGNARGTRTKTKVETNILKRKDVTPTHLTSILKDRGSLTAEALWTASQLEIDEFYDQIKDEEARGLLRESHGDSPTSPRVLEAIA